jgi:hypothetical protein
MGTGTLATLRMAINIPLIAINTKGIAKITATHK